MKPLRVAVWGLGPHAIRNIVPAVRQARGLKLFGVCSRNAANVEAVAAENDCAGWIAGTAMLGDPGVDVVYVATPIGLHAAHGRQVLAARKHLWCEKPLSPSAAETEALLRLSRATGLTICEGFMYLYHPQHAYLRNLLASGRLGIVHSITCRFGIPPLARPGFRDDPLLGGGAFLDVGAYPASAVVSLFADATPEVRFAEIRTATGCRVDTSGRAVVGFDNGADAALEWGINTSYRNEIDFWGTEGSVSTARVFSKPADYVPRFRFRDVSGNESDEYGVAANHFVAMLETFRGWVDDPNSAERERALIARRAELLDRIKEHAASGRQR